jgi:hypothetical protein
VLKSKHCFENLPGVFVQAVSVLGRKRLVNPVKDPLAGDTYPQHPQELKREFVIIKIAFHWIIVMG